MKTTDFNYHAVMIACAVLTLSQCSPGVDAIPESTGAATNSHWVKVSSRPPTFYPRGVAADCATDVHSGEWVYTDDAHGTRYFIPVRDWGKTPRQTLIEEALAARSENKLRRIEAEDQAEPYETSARILKKTPLVILGTVLSFGACPEWLAEADLKKEWHSSKKPRQ